MGDAVEKGMFRAKPIWAPVAVLPYITGQWGFQGRFFTSHTSMSSSVKWAHDMAHGGQDE